MTRLSRKGIPDCRHVLIGSEGELGQIFATVARDRLLVGLSDLGELLTVTGDLGDKEISTLPVRALCRPAQKYLALIGSH